MLSGWISPDGSRTGRGGTEDTPEPDLQAQQGPEGEAAIDAAVVERAENCLHDLPVQVVVERVVPGREDVLHVGAEVVPEPPADGNREAVLAFSQGFRRDQVPEGLPQQDLGPVPPELVRAGQTEGELHHAIIQKGHARLY